MAPHLSRRRFAALALVAIVFTAATLAGSTAQALDPTFNTDGLAIRGFDPVAYFTEGRPVEGEEAFSLRHDGAEWRFASAANRDAFAADPALYMPQYGGYCAWAVSQGYTASTDPDAWHVEDGKLYLNYSTSVQKRWARDIPGNIAKADENWPGLKGGN